MTMLDVALGDPFIPFAILSAALIALFVLREVWWKPWTLERKRRDISDIKAELRSVGQDVAASQRRARVSLVPGNERVR